MTKIIFIKTCNFLQTLAFEASAEAEPDFVPIGLKHFSSTLQGNNKLTPDEILEPTAEPTSNYRVPKQTKLADEAKVAKDAPFSNNLRFQGSPLDPPRVYPDPEFKLASHPTSSSFGVSVDFAGQLSDNPLFIDQPFEDKGVFERDILPDHLLQHNTYNDIPSSVIHSVVTIIFH